MSDLEDRLDHWVRDADRALRGTRLDTVEGSWAIDLVAEAPGGDRWHRITVDDGVVAGWDRLAAAPDDTDALRQDAALQLDALTRPGRPDGNEVIAASWIEERRGGEVVRRVAPSPRNALEEGHWRNLLPVPNATFTVQHVVEATPFGRITFHRAIVDGLEAEGGFGELGETDLRITQRYHRLVRLLYAGGDVLDSFEGGRADGNWTKLMTLGGIATSPEVEEQDRRGSVGGGLALGVLGEVMDTAAYRGLAEEVAAT